MLNRLIRLNNSTIYFDRNLFIKGKLKVAVKRLYIKGEMKLIKNVFKDQIKSGSIKIVKKVTDENN